MAGKQYEVVREFRRVDPESGEVTEYSPDGPNSTYSGPIEDEDQYTGPGGPDGKGPLVRTKAEIKEDEKAVAEAEKAAAEAQDTEAKTDTATEPRRGGTVYGGKGK